MFTKDYLSVSFRYYPENRITVCELSIYPALVRQRHTTDEHTINTIVFHGIARLKPGEQDNQLEAREIALGRALKNAGYQKEYRRIFTEAWKADYLSHHPTKPIAAPEQVVEIKTINGVTMRKLGKDEILRKGDWSDELIGNVVYGLAGDIVDSCPGYNFYRPISKPAPEPAKAPFKMGDFIINGTNKIVYIGDKPTTEHDALELSIKKWEFIEQYMTINPSRHVINNEESCGLCMLYSTGISTSCIDCPVYKKTGHTGCRGTPWTGLVELAEQAIAELEFLKSLRKQPVPPVVASNCVAYHNKSAKCQIPEGWYRLDEDELMDNGDKSCWMRPDGTTGTCVTSGKVGLRVSTLSSCLHGYNDKCVIRRLPADAKLIKGVWMRKLRPDEYPQAGDWWGDNENDRLGMFIPHNWKEKHPNDDLKYIHSKPFNKYYRPLQKDK